MTNVQQIESMSHGVPADGSGILDLEQLGLYWDYMEVIFPDRERTCLLCEGESYLLNVQSKDPNTPTGPTTLVCHGVPRVHTWADVARLIDALPPIIPSPCENRDDDHDRPQCVACRVFDMWVEEVSETLAYIRRSLGSESARGRARARRRHLAPYTLTDTGYGPVWTAPKTFGNVHPHVCPETMFTRPEVEPEEPSPHWSGVPVDESPEQEPEREVPEVEPDESTDEEFFAGDDEEWVG